MGEDLKGDAAKSTGLRAGLRKFEGCSQNAGSGVWVTGERGRLCNVQVRRHAKGEGPRLQGRWRRAGPGAYRAGAAPEWAPRTWAPERRAQPRPPASKRFAAAWSRRQSPPPEAATVLSYALPEVLLRAPEIIPPATDALRLALSVRRRAERPKPRTR